MVAFAPRRPTCGRTASTEAAMPGTHGGRPRCVIRDLGLLNVIREVRPLQFASAAHPGLTSIAVVHGKLSLYLDTLTEFTQIR